LLLNPIKFYRLLNGKMKMEVTCLRCCPWTKKACWNWLRISNITWLHLQIMQIIHIYHKSDASLNCSKVFFFMWWFVMWERHFTLLPPLFKFSIVILDILHPLLHYYLYDINWEWKIPWPGEKHMVKKAKKQEILMLRKFSSRWDMRCYPR
jgi:hypothetical protein